MATVTIGGGRPIRQLNYGDTVGEAWETRNIDLYENPGKITLAPVLTKTTSTTLDIELKALGYYAFRSTYYAITDDGMYGTTNLANAFTETLNSDVRSGDDAVVFDDSLLISERRNSGIQNRGIIQRSDMATIHTPAWWDGLAGKPTLAMDVPHTMDVSAGGTILYVTDGNKAHSFEGTTTSGTFHTVTVAEEQVLCTVKTTDYRTWLGSYTESAGTAYLYEWDGASPSASRAYAIGARACLAMELVGATPYVATERGEILRFNGAGFDTVARLPFTLTKAHVDNMDVGDVDNENSDRPIHPKGMKYREGKLYLFVSFKHSTIDPNHLQRTHNGVWVIDISTGSCNHMSTLDGYAELTKSSPILVVNEPTTRLVTGGFGVTQGIWIENYTGTNYGVFTTTEIVANSVADAYEAVYLSGHLNGGAVHIKYRTEQKYLTPPTADITWTSTTTFTTTDNLSAVAIGEEVDILRGTSAGRLTHITNIVNNSGTYTVTVADTLGSNGTTGEVRIDNWTYSGVWNTGTQAELGLGGDSAWKVQVRLYLVGTGIIIDRIMVHGNNKRTI
jgi:hypothetical protein